MTPDCDALHCNRKSVHTTYMIHIIKYRSIAVKVRINLCPDHFNEAMEHKYKRNQALARLTALTPYE